MTAPDYAAMTNREHADELEFLRWFYRNAPCHGEHSNALKTFEALDALNERFKEAIPLNAEKTVAAMYRNASLSPDDRELAESHLMYMRLASPRQHCVAFLKATEGVK